MRRILAQNDWSIGVDPHSGQTYYYNQQTGQSQWELPIGLGGAQQQGNLQQDHAYTLQQEQYGYDQGQNGLDQGQNAEAVNYICERLQEPQTRIVRAVVDFLGIAIAYELLDETERIQAQGGMIVPDTGRPRTSGGIYYKLLKEANHLPQEAQYAALQRIKVEGKKVKSWEKGVAW